jgi:hypothetical protein
MVGGTARSSRSIRVAVPLSPWDIAGKEGPSVTSNLRGSVLPIVCLAAVVVSALTPGAAVAQDKPIDLGSSSGQSLDELTGENEHPLQITGFGVGDFSYDQRSGDNTARAGKLAVAFFREVSDKVWFFGQLTTALASGDGVAAGDEVPTEIEIDNLLVNFTPGGASGLSLSFGKFDVPVGFERDDEPLDFQATSSFNFELARPSKMVGLVGRWAASPHLDVTAMAGNGWDAQLDPNHGKTAGLRVGLIPTERTSFGLSGLLGAEGDAGDAHNRYLLSADYAVEPGHGWIVAGEANLGGDRGVLQDGGNARWSGVTLTVFRRLAEHLGVTLRAETFRDADGARTGRVQTLRSLTLSPLVFVGTGREGIFANVEHTTFRIPRFQLRTEVRLDHSSVPIYEDSSGLHDSALRYVVQLVTTF